MSRTDKTKPFWVKLKHGDLTAIADHDHRDGVCNLPDEPGQNYYGPDHQYDCRWNFFWDGTNDCCCNLCRNCGWDIPPRKRQRLNSKKTCRDWVKEY